MPKPGFKTVTISEKDYFAYMKKKKYWSFIEGKQLSLAEFFHLRILGPDV